MAEKLVRQWGSDHTGNTGHFTMKVFETVGWWEKLKAFFSPRRSYDWPSESFPCFYEPVPVVLKSNQRIEIWEGDDLREAG